MLFNLANFLCMGTGAAAGTEGQKGSSVTMIIMMVVMLVVMYFIMIRPQKKKQQEEQKLRDSVQIGDEITTIGGISGRIVAIKEESDTLVLETGTDRHRIHVKRWAISTVDTQSAPPADIDTKKIKEAKHEAKHEKKED